MSHTQQRVISLLGTPVIPVEGTEGGEGRGGGVEEPHISASCQIPTWWQHGGGVVTIHGVPEGVFFRRRPPRCTCLQSVKIDVC